MRQRPILLAALLLLGMGTLLLACPPLDPDSDDDDSGDDDDVTADDDDATGDDDDATGDDDDAAGDDDDATGDDDDATGDDDDATGDDDDATGDDDDSSPAAGPLSFDLGMSCGYSLNSTTVGHANEADGYPACGLAATGWPGGEFVGTVGAGNTQHTLTLTWSDSSADLDLVVLDGSDPASATCYGSSTSTSQMTETVVFTLPSGSGWVIVDTKGAAGASFDLDISCP